MNTQSGARPAAMEVVAEETRYEGVGHSLRVVRERRGVALADVSARLRIRRPYLEAIEAGRFDELPGAVYITGFLRQYAEFLGLDAEQVLKTYQDEADASLRRPVLNFPMPRPEQRTPPLWLVIGALLVAGIIYILWYNHQAALRFGQELVEAVPPKLAELIPSTQPIAPASTAAPSTTAPSAATPPIATPSATAPATPVPNAAASAAPAAPSAPAAASTTTPSLPPPGGAAAPATPAPAAASVDPNSVTPAPATPAPATPAPAPSSAPAAAGGSNPATGASTTAADQPAAGAATETAVAEAAPAKPATYGALPGESRIQLEATAPAWIQVRGPNNEQIFTRLLNTGERYLVPDRSGLTLLTGNAGGLRIVVDGQALPPLGADGEVKRGIELDPDRLKAPPAAAANQG
ncbi:MAG TPA: RodZ domain-containing protein [Ferrovibrio sp.]|uniref:RodZ domain-containing protein n=1 Tax=Ferrovibrio sp. TaxID=1917215 RepID=UPI002ED272DE